MVKNNYWEEREKKWIQANIKQDQLMIKGLKERYESLIKSINNEINSFYMNYAIRDHISMDEAIKKVANFDVKEFEKTAAKMVKDKDFSKLANERLRVYNATMRINRLEMLKSKIGQELVAVDVETEKEIKAYLLKSYQEELSRQAGILGNQKIDIPAKRMNQIINASFNGATWSQRLWTAHTKLKANLDILVTQAMIQGKNPKTLINDLMPLIDKSISNRRYVAERLAITETARVQDQAQMDSFKANGFEYCYWIAEPTACDECIDIANAHEGLYKLSDVPGIPIHASCRCSKSAATDKPSKEAKEEIPKQQSSGAINGALNDKNDPNLGKRIKVADNMYNEFRNLDQSTLIQSIAKDTEIGEQSVQTVLNHVLFEEHSLYDNVTGGRSNRLFDPSYDMAQSIQRLRLNKQVEADIIMLKHEALEADLMTSKSMLYEDAHILANKQFNYAYAISKWKEGK